jgi:hypothetical protein
VTGPFEVTTLGRYSVEGWKGYVVRAAGAGEVAKLENTFRWPVAAAPPR